MMLQLKNVIELRLAPSRVNCGGFWNDFFELQKNSPAAAAERRGGGGECIVSGRPSVFSLSVGLNVGTGQELYSYRVYLPHGFC